MSVSMNYDRVALAGQAIGRILSSAIPLIKTTAFTLLAAVVLNNPPIDHHKTNFTHRTIDNLDSIKDCPFLAQHGDELMVADWRSPPGDWKFLGAGFAKSVYTHPGLPNYVFKVIRGANAEPNTDFGTYIEQYLHNVKLAKDIVNREKFKHIVIPNTLAIRELNNKKVSILFEERFRFSRDSAYKMSIDPEYKIRLKPYLKELKQFLDLCKGCAPVHFETYRNAELLEDESKIVVYDLDGF